MSARKNEVMRENEDLQVEKISDELYGKTIALCITGGIAAIETPKIARHLRRYGAEVQAYMTPVSLKFVGEASLEWGTGKRVVTELSGLAEHICLEDLVLIAPATLNTINKMLLGIADNSVTALAASALGKKIPVYICPTMHQSLYDNPFLQKNMAEAEKYGIRIIKPVLAENKAKLPRISTITNAVREYFSAGIGDEEKNEKTA